MVNHTSRKTTLAIRSLVVWAVLAASSLASADSHYTVDLADGASGILHVAMRTECAAYPCDLELPAWSATYQIRNFSQYLGPVRAEAADGDEVAIRKVGPSRWQLLSAPSPEVIVRYNVRADRDGPFGAAVRADRATLNLAQVLMFVRGQREESAHLHFTGVHQQFREALTHPTRDGEYFAPSYDRLVDTPVLLADFEETRFEVGGKSIRVVVYGPNASDRVSSLRRIARKVVKAGIDLMGDAPFEEYTFVYVFSDRGGGGMEYRNGTLIFAPTDCTSCGLDELTAHEFFHLWNVKRIRPASMEAVDWSRPVPSPSLWFAEGVTSTYAQYLNLAAELRTGQGLLGRIEELINRYEARPARLVQSVEESSIDAWLEGSAAYHRPDRSVSYYLKGELIGYLLDLEIRGRTQNRRSLDDMMRQLNSEYAQQGRYFGDTMGLIEAASTVIDGDMGEVFDALVRTATPIDWDHYLGLAGYHVEQMPATRRTVGLSLANPPGTGVVVSVVTLGGAGEVAGFRVGDQLATINGQRVVGGTAAALSTLEMTDRVSTVTVRRDNLEIPLQVKARHHKVIEHRIVSLADVRPAQSLVRDGWLSRTTVDDSTR